MKRNFFRKFLIASIFAAVALSLHTVQAQSLPSGVQDAVKMKQAGLSDDVIVSQIKSSGATYNLTADQLIYLKNQGVSEAVIKALISGNGGAPAPTAPPPTIATPPLAPTTPPPAPEPPPAPGVASAPTAPPPAAPGVSFEAFQAQLAPYGNWISVPGYGPCWEPAVAVADPLWRPYLDSGHWIYTDQGWSWQSDYPWGDIAFHYGRWFRHNGIWAWVPGYDWAPAWVTWREADGYSGWAPLPPTAVYRAGLGLYYNGGLALDVDFGLGPDDFTFVPYDHFWDFHLRTFFVPHDRVDFFFHHSHIMNGYHVDHGRFVVEGLGHDHVFAVTHHDARIEHESHGRFDSHDSHDRDSHDSRDSRDRHGW
ncbi:MAG TPA: DUF6600 domain-containing protein [Verrucomicrobiae bacterium]|nr:DUF6600 domain-containing protein [Verrucomicrobiae bacterium]